MAKTMNRNELVTENNALGLQAFDLVQTAGKGICIVLHKESANELVVYSQSSIEKYPHNDDGMAYVRRYNADGTIASTSESGKTLKNRDIYTITGIKSYDDIVMALKDFINQNEEDFDPVYVEVEEDDYDYDFEEVEADETEAPTQMEINMQILAMLNKINEKLG